jgi:4-diphosphocytidyl-2C-methyl-D-erythritol kinase
MPTGPAFGRIAASRGAEYRVPTHAFDLAALRGWEALEPLAENHFGPVADAEIPSLVHARQRMREAGATIAMLSGSGASLFGVFPTTDRRDAALGRLAGEGWAAWRAETLQTVPPPQVDPAGSFG